MLCLHKCRFHWPSHSETTQQVVGIVQSATTTTMRLGRLKEINFRHCWVEGSSPLVQHSLPAISWKQSGTSLPVLRNVYGRNQKIQSFFLVFFSIVFFSIFWCFPGAKRGPTATDVGLLARHVPQSQKTSRFFRRPKTSNFGTKFLG